LRFPVNFFSYTLISAVIFFVYFYFEVFVLIANDLSAVSVYIYTGMEMWGREMV
jgi:hypothetical protein